MDRVEQKVYMVSENQKKYVYIVFDLCFEGPLETYSASNNIHRRLISEQCLGNFEYAKWQCLKKQLWLLLFWSIFR